ncbi:MAG: L-seryl-tRNA(Sec) selenium transferase [Actinobacteria bacterium]|nr:L-seryl-tRNA(Sec) selenium transferase [Actinomycetota bacterium]
MPARGQDTPLSGLPRVDDLVAAAGRLVERHGRPAATEALRRAVGDARRRLLDGDTRAPSVGDLVAAAGRDLAARRPGGPRRVLNAAGVVVHTNLGRAPLSAAAREAVWQAAGYCDLELDLVGGGRGSRSAHLSPLLEEACGAESGFAVNNAAAALVLALAALTGGDEERAGPPGREVLVSRGELVEIGGSFRLPEIMAASGARLVEVGTTNRTRARDYVTGGSTALILKVHPANYTITGYAAAPSVAELAEVARGAGVPLVHDTGSGLLDDAPDPWLAGEPSVRGSLCAGADLVVCSGDKLLGGPQAGLLVGRADLVDACRHHPLARAVRLDKLRIAALVATLEAHLRHAADTEVPVWAMLRADPAALALRADALARGVGGRVVDGASLPGGGSAPGSRLPGPVVRVDVAAPGEAAAALRAGDPPIVARVDDGALWLDPRTVDAADDAVLADRVAAVVSA